MIIKSKYLLFVILLFLVCIGTYFNSLFYDFVFDDISLVVNNPYIKSSSYIGKTFQKDLWHFAYEGNKPNYYRPLQTLSFMLDYRFWRLNPFGYHLSNVFLHFLNGLLVFSLIYLLFNNFFIAVISSLLFCVHPINSSTVAYISGRGDLLSGAFILLTFLFFILLYKFPKHKKLNFVFAALFFVAALLSKEIAIVVPFGLIILLYFCNVKDRSKTLFLLTAILLVSLYLYLRLVVWNVPLSKQNFLYLSFILSTINFLYLLISYVFLLVMPVNLRLTHTANPIFSWVDLRLYITLIFFISGLIFWHIKRHNKIINFSLIWFFIFAFPVFFIMTGFSENKLCMAENWIYIAAIGFYVILSYLLYILWSDHKAIANCFVVVILSIFAIITIFSNSNFKNRINLASHMLLFNSEDKEAHKELASAYLENKQYSNALEHIDRAMKLGPVDIDSYMLKASYYEDTGDIGRAIDSYEKILNIESNSARANNNLGAIYFNKAQFNKARIFFEKAIKLNRLMPESYLNMGKLCQYNNEIAEAVDFYKQAVKLNPDFQEVFVNLAKIYLNKRDFYSALDILNKALNSGHGADSVLMLLGIANEELGFDEKAGYYFLKLSEFSPKSQDVILNLGIFYANRGQLNKAINIWQEGLRDLPDNKIIRENIERAKQLLGQGR